MSTLADQIRSIRKAENLSRKALAEMAGIPERTLEGIEQGRQVPGGDILKKISKAWPKYAYWLMTDEVMPEAGHVSPEIEIARRDSQREKQVG